MKTTWKDIAPVPTSQEFLDIVLSRTQRRLPTQIRAGFKISRIRAFYIRKVKYTSETFAEKLSLNNPPTTYIWLPRDRRTVDQVVSIYFEKLNYHRPVFTRTDFDAALQQLYSGSMQHDPGLLCSVYLIFALGSMIGIGSATRYALGKGSNAPDYHLYFSNSIIWTLLVGAVFVALGVAVPDGVLRLMGADETILQVGHNYIRIVLCFAPLFMLNFTCTAFVRNDGAPRIAMAATLLSGLFNILFDYLLMFPLGLGMTGAALATGFSPVVSMSICLLLMFGFVLYSLIRAVVVQDIMYPGRDEDYNDH